MPLNKPIKGAVDWADTLNTALDYLDAKPVATGPTGPTGAQGAASTVTGPTGPTGADSTVVGPTGPTGPTGANFTGYDNEIHVSQVDGDDTTGNGDLLTPVATITKALTLVAGQRRIVVVHSGGYTENPTITTAYTTITTRDLKGDNTILYGTLSTSVACTVSGLKMTNLTIANPTGTGVVNLLNSDVSGTLTKSNSGDYTFIRFTNFGAANITGTGLVDIYGGTSTLLTVNNANAVVLLKNGTAIAPVVTAGNLSVVQAVVVAAGGDAITTSAGTIITLANSQLVTAALTNVAPVTFNGFYSIINTVFDKPGSTLVALSGTGGSTSSVVYSQFVNADKFVTQGGTSTQFVKGDGSLDSTGPVGPTGPSGGITYNVTNAGSGNYLINGASNPTLPFIRGHRYIINVNASGHPFWIQTVSGAYSAGNVYNTGVTNNGAEVGTIIVEVAFDAPQLYYACQYHSSMQGSITVSDLGPTGADGGFDSAQVTETKATSYTLTSADAGKLLLNSAAITITVQGLAVGEQVDFLQNVAGQITFAAGAGMTLNSKGGKLLTAEQYSPAGVKCVATNIYVLVGDLGA